MPLPQQLATGTPQRQERTGQEATHHVTSDSRHEEKDMSARTVSLCVRLKC